MRGPGKAFVLASSDARGRGRPVLLVHGFSHSRVVWEKVARDMAAEFRPICVDLRGHGESEWSLEGHYAVGDYALDLSATLDALDIERAVVVAHSLGGSASTFFAAQAPERVEALVLVDTGPCLSLDGLLHVARDVGETLGSYPSVAAFRERLAMTHPLGDPELLDRMAETGVVRRRDGRFEPRLDPGVLLGSSGDVDPLYLETLEADLWQALGRVRCPTLVVRGGLSAMLQDADARRMVDEVVPDARLEVLEKAGHGVMLDDGPGLLRCVEGFLGRL